MFYHCPALCFHYLGLQHHYSVHVRSMKIATQYSVLPNTLTCQACTDKPVLIFPWAHSPKQDLSCYQFQIEALLIYLPGFYCLSLVTMLAAHLAGKGMLINNLLASGIALIFVITGDVLFIQSGGIYAAALVSSLGYFICLIYLLLSYKKKWGSKPAAFIVTRHSDLQLLFRRFFPQYPFQ